jgi:hypothetical protein
MQKAKGKRQNAGWSIAVACWLLAVAAVFMTGCDQESFSTIVVTAQVAKTLNPESNTASILVGKATIANLFHDDWMDTPDPGDTSFANYMFPARIEPVGGAAVTLNSGTVAQRLPGVYFAAALDLQYLSRYDMSITTDDGKVITAHGFLPDSFGIVQPQQGDSFGLGDVAATWTSSESCETFIVGVNPVDTASLAVGWSDSRTDTFCTIPASAFRDSLGNFVPGDYVFGVTAVNGGWNKSGLDLFLSGGNVSGASGVFGCAVYPRPVVIRVY